MQCLHCTAHRHVAVVCTGKTNQPMATALPRVHCCREGEMQPLYGVGAARSSRLQGGGMWGASSGAELSIGKARRRDAGELALGQSQTSSVRAHPTASTVPTKAPSALPPLFQEQPQGKIVTGAVQRGDAAATDRASVAGVVLGDSMCSRGSREQR